MYQTDMDNPYSVTRIHSIRDRWVAKARNTDPVDRPAAEVLLRAAYDAAELPAPELIIWAGSPLSASAITWFMGRAERLSWNVSQYEEKLEQIGIYNPQIPIAMRPLLAREVPVTRGQDVTYRLRDRFLQPVLAYWDRNEEIVYRLRYVYGHAFDVLSVDSDSIAISNARALLAERVEQRITNPLLREAQRQICAAGEDPDTAAEVAAELDTLDPGALLPVPYFAADLFEPVLPEARLAEPLLRLTEATGGWRCFERVAVLCDRPVYIRLDGTGRLDSTDGPAVEYRDGFKVWAWHGVCIPERFATQLNQITLSDIETELNDEIRRVLIEKVGPERLVQLANMRIIHTDSRGELYRGTIRQKDFAVLKVLNSTPEPDGSHKSYFLHVPPWVTRASEAVAWTFGLDEQRYAPLAET